MPTAGSAADVDSNNNVVGRVDDPLGQAQRRLGRISEDMDQDQKMTLAKMVDAVADCAAKMK